MSSVAPITGLCELISHLHALCDGRLRLEVQEGDVAFYEDGEESPSVVQGFGMLIDDARYEETLRTAVDALLDQVQDSMMEMLHGPWPVLDGRAAMNAECEVGAGSTLLAGFTDSSGWVWVVPVSTVGDWRG